MYLVQGKSCVSVRPLTDRAHGTSFFTQPAAAAPAFPACFEVLHVATTP